VTVAPTIYVVDTSSFRVFGNYYPDTFTTFWTQLNALVSDGRLMSVSEVKKEIDIQVVIPHLADWVTQHSYIFRTPTEAEMTAVAQVFKVPKFRELIGGKQLARGSPVADPFVIARGIIAGACVVTEEEHKPNASKIPNVCEHFGVKHTNVQGLLKQEGWRY
jgi:hypothetical protein